MKKFILPLLAVALVALAVAAFYLMRNLGSIVETRIESTGTDMLGRPVEVGSVEIDLGAGAGEIRNLTLANPEGYTDPYAFSMDLIRLGIDISSLGGSPKRLDELVIESPAVSLEVKEDLQSNLGELAARLKREIEARPDKPEPAEEEPADIRLAVDRLRVAGVNLTLRHPELEDGPKQITLPDIELRDLGGEEGVTGAELGLEIVEAVIREGLKRTAEAEIRERASGLLQQGLDRLKAPKEN